LTDRYVSVHDLRDMAEVEREPVASAAGLGRRVFDDGDFDRRGESSAENDEVSVPSGARRATGSLRRRWRSRCAAAALAVVGLVTLLPSTAAAHAGDESYVYLEVSDDDLRGRVEMPYVDLRTVFGFDLEGSNEEIRAELEANIEVLQSYASERLSIGSGGTDWSIEFEGILTLTDFVEEDSDGYAVLPFVVDLRGADVPQVLDTRFDPFFDEIEGRSALLLIANDWQRGVFDNEAEALVKFDAGSRAQSVDLGDSSQWKNFSESISLGADHIKTGPDHIFFVLVLLLPSVLIYTASRWVPEPTFGASLWRVLKIVSMFTVAHSITFTLAGLDILPLPPSRLVESVIAASIAAAALHNLWPIGANKEWLIAFVFGLFHGMGFASLVSDLEVSKTTQLVSLLGRNVGIEIGQAVIVLVMFPGLYLLRRSMLYRPFFVIGSLVLAFVSLGWMLERILEIEVGTSDVIDKVVRFPRVMILVAAFNLAGAAVYYWERSRGRLIDVHQGGEVADEEPDDEDDDDLTPSPVFADSGR
jgi:hypothetical protein